MEMSRSDFYTLWGFSKVRNGSAIMNFTNPQNEIAAPAGTHGTSATAHCPATPNNKQRQFPNEAPT
jgi:hypothetical protein